MGVGDQLGLGKDSELLAQARQHWPAWVASDPCLGVVHRFQDLSAWLPTASPDGADEVLLCLAQRAALDGGDDVVAAAALASCLLPGACRLAAWLCSRPAQDLFRDSQPVRAGGWWAGARIDELVASELWIQVRSFPWQRRTKVAANVLTATRFGVLRQLGDDSQVARADRTWARTLVAPDVRELEEPGPARAATGSGAAAAALDGSHSSEAADNPLGDPSAREELREVLAWACAHKVISKADRRLLLCLVEEAHRQGVRNVGHGYGGLIGTELSVRVAPRLGVSQATVRRHASRTVRALAEAVPRRFVGG